jgi:hypothetical protein
MAILDNQYPHKPCPHSRLGAMQTGKGSSGFQGERYSTIERERVLALEKKSLG